MRYFLVVIIFFSAVNLNAQKHQASSASTSPYHYRLHVILNAPHYRYQLFLSPLHWKLIGQLDPNLSRFLGDELDGPKPSTST